MTAVVRLTVGAHSCPHVLVQPRGGAGLLWGHTLGSKLGRALSGLTQPCPEIKLIFIPY